MERNGTSEPQARWNHWGGPHRAGDGTDRAVPWPRVQQALEGLEWCGQIVIDATNDFEPSDLNGSSSSEVAAGLVRGARVVKAANTLAAAVLGFGAPLAGVNLIRF